MPLLWSARQGVSGFIVFLHTEISRKLEEDEAEKDPNLSTEIAEAANEAVSLVRFFYLS
jgi:hypothetical protein